MDIPDTKLKNKQKQAGERFPCLHRKVSANTSLCELLPAALGLWNTFTLHSGASSLSTRKCPQRTYVCSWGTLLALPSVKATRVKWQRCCSLLLLNIPLRLGPNNQFWWTISMPVKSWLHKTSISWCKFAYSLRFYYTLVYVKATRMGKRMFGFSMFRVPPTSSPKGNLSFMAFFQGYIHMTALVCWRLSVCSSRALLVQGWIPTRLGAFSLFV